MDYLEFIARVTSHIPDKGQVTVRYYGLYANAHRNKVGKSKGDEHHLLIIKEQFPTVLDISSSRDLYFLTIVGGVNRRNEDDSTTTAEKETLIF